MSKERVAVVMGGPSSERDVSLASGRGVLGALDRLGYDSRSLDFDARFVDALRALQPDIVFNALHGVGGEDGTLQGLLDWLRMPYTGSDLRSCALAIDKHLTKKLLSAEGLPTPAWDTFDFDGGTLPLLPGSLNLPLVVKPRDEGSSTGVTLVRTHEEWSRTMIELSERRSAVLAEEFVDGREFSCGVLFGEALPVIEIVPTDRSFYDYEAKYRAGASSHDVPAKIDEELAHRLQMLALSTHRLLGLRDYSRTDFIVTAGGRPYILEINALPGLTATSLLPEECLAAGIGYDALVDRLVRAALDRGRADADV
ncbi:MAG: D-alanine--D-alanine ligase [Candidatus Eremiobacteraeota bacterium]|nr:D-alanine--D-alanine ligase [Candidatus Eremiobacteraeota bacterium]MBC5820473.1 D-alanine--D-alanine ligase [Candidatus Eremiobacteraeota bacterium]